MTAKITHTRRITEDTHATKAHNLYIAILCEGGTPNEKDSRHHSEEHKSGQVELDEEGVTIVRLQTALGLGLRRGGHRSKMVGWVTGLLVGALPG